MDAVREHGGREEWSEGLRSWVSKGEGKENRRPLTDKGNVADRQDDNNYEENQAIKKERQERDWALRNFWLAWDALDPE